MNSETPSLWPDVGISSSGGVPTLVINGTPRFAWSVHRPYAGHYLKPYERLAGCGLKLFQIDATCSEDCYHPEIRYWTAPDRFDPGPQEEIFQRLVDIQPEALFNLRIYCGPPAWWMEAHPEEWQRGGRGEKLADLQMRGPSPLVSLASEKWKQDLGGALRHYIQWLKSSGWSRRVAGLMLGYGITWEWGILGTDTLPDTSVPALNYFRDWLRTRYRTPEALSRAWGRTLTDFDEAEIPPVEKRTLSYGENGRRPLPGDQDVVDHQNCLSDMNSDLLLHAASIAREETGGHPFIGGFYGYTLTARENTSFTGRYGPGGLTGGHHALGRVLRSPDIDCLASPFNYLDRSLQTGAPLEHIPLASVHAHGKLFMEENDSFQYGGGVHPLAGSHMGNLDMGGSATEEEGLQKLRVAFAGALVRGKHQWFAELSCWIDRYPRENYASEALRREIQRLNSLGEQLISLNRKPCTEVAFVWDERSVAELGYDHKAYLHRVYEKHTQWLRMGVPVDFLLLEDLPREQNPYRLVVGACVVSAEARQALHAWARAHPEAEILMEDDGLAPENAGKIRERLANGPIHRYLEDDTLVWAAGEFLFCQFNRAGTREVHSRIREPLCEVFTGEVLTPGADGVLSCRPQAGQSLLWVPSRLYTPCIPARKHRPPLDLPPTRH